MDATVADGQTQAKSEPITTEASFETELISFWFNNSKLWFNCTPDNDRLITDKYEMYLGLGNPTNNKQINPLAKIILYDQIHRHICRHKKIDLSIEYDEIALHTAMSILDHDNDLSDYTPQQKCFILLPLRHTKRNELIDLSLQLINYWRSISLYNNDADSVKIYDRFIRATITKRLELEPPMFHPVETMTYNVMTNVMTSVICPKSVCVSNIDKSISDILVKSKFRHIEDAVWNILKKQPEKSFVVSLSGGVDSMVLSYILTSLRRKYNFDLRAVHISYNNRPLENNLEIELVKRWCDNLNISLYIRKITEIVKSDFVNTNRELYETMTRKIRFGTYRWMSNPRRAKILLGHNKDDCFENIITNIKRKQSYNNLRGMTEISHEDGVDILRPFLNVYKDDLYDFAVQHKIPHLKTSTPAFCERGRIRNELIPKLNEYDRSFVENMFIMAGHYASVYNTYNEVVKKIIADYNDNGHIKVSHLNEVYFDINLWRQVFDVLMNVRVSYKSLNNVVKRLKNKQYGKIIVSPRISIVFSSDGKITF